MRNEEAKKKATSACEEQTEKQQACRRHLFQASVSAPPADKFRMPENEVKHCEPVKKLQIDSRFLFNGPRQKKKDVR